MTQTIQWLQRRRGVASGLIIFVVGLVAYGYAILLPYHIDDFIQLRWVTTHTLAEIWTSAAGLSYLRPLPFTLWKMVYWLNGSYPPDLVHALNVVVHALNGVLLFQLLRLHRRDSRGNMLVAMAAGILFLLFPFSYQAVPWVGALNHPLVTLLVLGSVALAAYGRENGVRAMQIVALGLALLAPFAHETGVLLALVLTLYGWTASPTRTLKQTLKITWPYWICSILAMAVLLTLRAGSGLKPQTLDLISRWQNAVYFLQGLAYPVAPFAQLLRHWFPGLNDLLSILIVCVPVIAVVAWIYVRMGYGRQVLLAIGWYGVMIAPAWLLLGFNYVVDGPRLMYEAAPGATIFWTLPLAIALERLGRSKGNANVTDPSAGNARADGAYVSAHTQAGRRRGNSRAGWLKGGGVVAAALIVAGVGVESVLFLNEHADMYEETRDAASGLLQAVAAPASDKSLVISVNFPGWIAPLTPTYALGHEGVTFIPDYSSVIDLVWTMTGQDRPIASVVIPELQSHWRFNYRNYGAEWTLPALQPSLREARLVLFTSYRDHDLATYNVGNLEYENLSRPTQYVSAYNGQLALLTGEWQKTGDTLQVTLHWQSWLTLTQEVRTFVHLQNEAGELVAQEDGLPMMGVANPLWWKPGDQWRDMRVLALPNGLQPGKYMLRVGVYPASGGERYNALDPTGKRYPDDAATLATIEIP
jgi:hypothetical protein